MTSKFSGGMQARTWYFIDQAGHRHPFYAQGRVGINRDGAVLDAALNGKGIAWLPDLLVSETLKEASRRSPSGISARRIFPFTPSGQKVTTYRGWYAASSTCWRNASLSRCRGNGRGRRPERPITAASLQVLALRPVCYTATDRGAVRPISPRRPLLGRRALPSSPHRSPSTGGSYCLQI
jgi:hypothetical protein